jgi:hypothetical protein
MDINTYLELSQKNVEAHADALRSDFEEYVFLYIQENMPEVLDDLKNKFDLIYSGIYAARENQANQARILEERWEDVPF